MVSETSYWKSEYDTAYLEPEQEFFVLSSGGGNAEETLLPMDAFPPPPRVFQNRVGGGESSFLY